MVLRAAQLGRAHAGVLARAHEVAGQREVHLGARAQAFQVDHGRAPRGRVDPIGLALVDAQDEGRPVGRVPRLQPHARAGVPHSRDDSGPDGAAVLEHDRRLLEVDVGNGRGGGGGQEGEESKKGHALGGLDRGRGLSYAVPPRLPEKRVVR